MADLTQTAASVARVSGNKQEKTAGSASMTAGMPVYDDGANGVKPAQADAAATADVVGILLNNGGTSQPLIIQTDGVINLGATLTVGEVYALSAANPGKIAPVSDLASTNIVTILGVAITAANLQLGIINSGTAKP